MSQTSNGQLHSPIVTTKAVVVQVKYRQLVNIVTLKTLGTAVCCGIVVLVVAGWARRERRPLAARLVLSFETPGSLVTIPICGKRKLPQFFI